MEGYHSPTIICQPATPSIKLMGTTHIQGKNDSELIICLLLIAINILSALNFQVQVIMALGW